MTCYILRLLSIISTISLAYSLNSTMAQSQAPPKNSLQPLAKDEILRASASSPSKRKFSSYTLVAKLSNKALGRDDDLYIRMMAPEVVDSKTSTDWAMFYDQHAATNGFVELNILNVKSDLTFLIAFEVNSNEKDQEFQIVDSLNGIDERLKVATPAVRRVFVVVDAKAMGNYRPTIKNLKQGQWGFFNCAIYEVK